MPVLKYVEHPTAAKIVLFEDMQNFISSSYEKQYDLGEGLGGTVHPGERFPFDLRACALSEPGTLTINGWKEQAGRQPNIKVALTDLVATRRMDSGVYIIAVPAWSEGNEGEF